MKRRTVITITIASDLEHPLQKEELDHLFSELAAHIQGRQASPRVVVTAHVQPASRQVVEIGQKP